MLDKKSVKVNLLEREAQNVKRMLEELLWVRYKKLVKTITQNQTLPSELLTVEEAKMCESFVTFSGAYRKFAEGLIQGQTAKVEAEVSHKRMTLRFAKSTPAIIGLDMKTYGPFMVEDVASLPVENAKILVKQGLAVLVEVS
jgi:DNA replication initiation complex subunit (GINS family)